MNYVKNEKNFTPTIAGAVSGVTKQVSGLNGILQHFQDNDNNLKATKLGGIGDPIASTNIDKNINTLAQFSGSNANVSPAIEGSQHFVFQQSTGAGYGSQIATNYGATPRMALRSYTPTTYSGWAEVYTTSHKPTKADVGLEHVPNYGASSVINSARNDQLATSGAVKQAYDRGTDGINKANVAQSRADSAYKLADGKTTYAEAITAAKDNAVKLIGESVVNDFVLHGNSTEAMKIYNARGGVTIEGHGGDVDLNAKFRAGINLSVEYPDKAITVHGKFVNNSDISLKEDINLEEDALEKLTSLNGYSYKFKAHEGEGLTSGVIAQEVEQIYPHMVITNEETGIKSVAYTELIAPMIEAIKELKTMNEKLTARVSELESK